MSGGSHSILAPFLAQVAAADGTIMTTITKLKNTSLSEHNQTTLDLKMLGTEDGKAKLLDMINSSL